MANGSANDDPQRDPRHDRAGSDAGDWTDRDIVLEYFPATHERLVPHDLRFQLEDAGDGAIVVRDREGAEVARLNVVTPTGNPTGELCCDLCQRTGTRRYLGLYRAELPGSAGRRYRYLTACRERRSCEARRLDDTGILALLRSTTR